MNTAAWIWVLFSIYAISVVAIRLGQLVVQLCSIGLKIETMYIQDSMYNTNPVLRRAERPQRAISCIPVLLTNSFSFIFFTDGVCRLMSPSFFPENTVQDFSVCQMPSVPVKGMLLLEMGLWPKTRLIFWSFGLLQSLHVLFLFPT